METKGRARARVASCLALNACSPACRYLFSASSAHSPVLSACKWLWVWLQLPSRPPACRPLRLCHLFMGRSICEDMEIAHRCRAWQMEIYHAPYMSGGSGVVVEGGKVIYIPHHTPPSSSFSHLCCPFLPLILLHNQFTSTRPKPLPPWQMTPKKKKGKKESTSWIYCAINLLVFTKNSPIA